MKKYLTIILTAAFFLAAETLFEVKDASDNPVLNVSTDGLRVMNEGDTLMVISSDAIRANIGLNSKGLSRAFSVTTTQSKGASALEVNSGSTTIGTPSTLIGSESTIMRQGLGGDDYSKFSPENIFIGLNAGDSTNTAPPEGIDNVFLGNFSGPANIGGSKNIFMGFMSGFSNDVGSYNAFLGYKAGYGNLSGSFNVIIGSEAGQMTSANLYNVFIGTHSGFFSTGDGNTFTGYASGYNSTSGYQNSFFGQRAGGSNKTGYFNNYFGYSAGERNEDGVGNCVFGRETGYGAVAATYNYNCLFGNYTGKLLTTGGSNVMTGYYTGYKTTSGSNNVYIGEKSGYENQTGSGNIFLGYNAGYNETGSNRLYIDNSDTTYPLIYGQFDSRMCVIDGTASDNPNNRKLFVYGSAGGTTAWYNDSDKRLKKNIKTIDSALDKVMKLRGVTFEWDGGKRYQTGKSIGFIAQEAVEVIPELVDYNEENDSYGMQYAPVTALLVEAVKEQNIEITELKKANEKLMRELQEIKDMINNK